MLLSFASAARVGSASSPCSLLRMTASSLLSNKLPTTSSLLQSNPFTTLSNKTPIVLVPSTKTNAFPSSWSNIRGFDHFSSSPFSWASSVANRRSFTELATAPAELDDSGFSDLSKKTLGAKSVLFQSIPESVIEEATGIKKTKEEEEVWAVARRRNVRISMKKLVPIANQIRGLNYLEAVAQMKFSPKKILPPILSAMLKQARGNAVDKYGWDPSRLIVDIQVGKGTSGNPRIEFRARGRHGIQRTSFSHITVSVRPVPTFENERRVGKAGLTHKSLPERLLTKEEQQSIIQETKEKKKQDREERLKRAEESKRKAMEERKKKDEEFVLPPPGEDVIEALIPIRRKLTIRDLQPRPKLPNIKELFREMYRDTMDEEWRQTFKSVHLPLLLPGAKLKAPVKLENLKKLPQDIADARQRIERSKLELAAELEKKKKQREEFAVNLEKLDSEFKQSKAKEVAERELRKKQNEEKEKELREKLAVLRANRQKKSP